MDKAEKLEEKLKEKKQLEDAEKAVKVEAELKKQERLRVIQEREVQKVSNPI